MVKDFDPQPVITKDNVTMQIDTVVYFQITDPKLYTYGVEYPISAIENLTATTLRNIIGDQAEGEKKSSILIAEGEKESAILRAEAQKESQIKIAEGEAEAMLKIKEAEAQGLKLLKDAKVDQSVLTLKSYETMTNMANGQATKLIIPSDLKGIATLGSTLAESLEKKQNKKSDK